MNKIILVLFLILLARASALAQNQTYSDTFTITTYYPAPHGVYGTMRLYPGREPSEGVAPGVIYYNATEDMLKFHNNTTWVNLSGGSGVGLWTQQGGTSNIYNTDTSGSVGIGITSPSQKLEVNGSVLATGDVCNGAGKCLSSMYLNNVIAGSNPGCPTGQTAILRASNGAWYVPSQVTTWTQVICGQAMSADGTALLVNNVHTVKNCNDAGGTVVGDGSGNNMCKLPGSTCPPQWYQFNRWSETQAGYCAPLQGAACGAQGACTTSRHNWNNDGTIEGCRYMVTCGWSYCHCQWVDTPCYATISQIGCY